jgi:hypothetical protein
MQRRLTVEEHNVVVLEMALNDISIFEISGCIIPVGEFQVDRVATVILLDDSLRSWPDIDSILDTLAELLDIVSLYPFGVGKVLGDKLRDSHLIDTEVRVRGDDGSSREVHTLSREVSSEAALLALQALAEAPRGFTESRLLEAGNITIDVHGDLGLQVLPLFHDRLNRRAFLQGRSDHAANPDDIGELGGDVVFIASIVLGNRGSDANWRGRQKLPDKHFRTTFGRVEAKELAVGRAYHLEEVENPQWIQILHGLAKMLIELRVLALRLSEGVVELDLALGGDLLHRGGLVVKGELVVGKFEDTNLSNLAVDGATVWAGLDLSAFCINLFAYLSSA